MKTQRTKQVRAVRWLSTLLMFGAALILVFPASAWAVGTAANTDINNRATIDYDVGGSTITVESSPTGNSTTGAGNGTDTFFEVDQMVDLAVGRPAVAYTPGVAGSTTAVLTFTVANTGNDTFDFNLSGVDLTAAATDPFGGNDNLDGVVVNGIYVDSDGPGPTGGGSPYSSGAHTYDGSDTATFINDLAQDQMINVYMECTIPGTATNGQIAVMLLRAEARRASDNADLSQSALADDPTVVDVVFGDDDGDAGGQDNDSARNSEDVEIDAFLIQAPSLTVTKTSLVVRDPFNAGTNPKAIPGAYVRYTITIANSGTAPATLTTLSDVLQAELTFEPDLRDATDTPENGVGIGFRAEAPAGRAWGGPRYFTSANDADGMDYDGTNTVSAAFANVLPVEAGYAAGELRTAETVTLRFNVVID